MLWYGPGCFVVGVWSMCAIHQASRYPSELAVKIQLKHVPRLVKCMERRMKYMQLRL
jgi:hypothetical protein